MTKKYTLKELKKLAEAKKDTRIIKARPSRIPDNLPHDYHYILKKETERKLGIWLD